MPHPQHCHLNNRGAKSVAFALNPGEEAMQQREFVALMSCWCSANIQETNGGSGSYRHTRCRDGGAEPRVSAARAFFMNSESSAG